MSRMIKCDRCGTMIYEDSRNDTGDYCEIGILHKSDFSKYHFCKECYTKFFTEFICEEARNKECVDGEKEYLN